MSRLDELREQYPDTLGRLQEHELVSVLADTAGTTPEDIAAMSGLDPNRYRQNEGLGGDMWTSFKKGASNLITEGVPGLIDMGVGLATAPSRHAYGALTGNEVEGIAPATRMAEGLADLTGISGDAYEGRLNLQYSPEQQQLNQETAAVDEATGMRDLTGALSAALTGQGEEGAVQQAWDDLQLGEWLSHYGSNAGRLAPNLIAESAPSLAAGLGVGGAVAKGAQALRAAGAIGQRTADLTARAAPFAGEGLVAGGQQTGHLLAEGVHPDEAALTGGVTSLIVGGVGGAGGQLANRLGAGDINQAGFRAGREAAQDAAAQAGREPLSYFPRMGVGAGIEAGEELLQSGSEQTLANVAQDKPFLEGTPSAMAQGSLAGAGMGLAFNIIPGGKSVDLTQERTETDGQETDGQETDQPLPDWARNLDPNADLPAEFKLTPEQREEKRREAAINELTAPPDFLRSTTPASQKTPKDKQLASDELTLSSPEAQALGEFARDAFKNLGYTNKLHEKTGLPKQDVLTEVERVATMDPAQLQDYVDARSRMKKPGAAWKNDLIQKRAEQLGIEPPSPSQKTPKQPANATPSTPPAPPPAPPAGVTTATTPTVEPPQADASAEPAAAPEYEATSFVGRLQDEERSGVTNQLTAIEAAGLNPAIAQARRAAVITNAGLPQAERDQLLQEIATPYEATSPIKALAQPGVTPPLAPQPIAQEATTPPVVWESREAAEAAEMPASVIEKAYIKNGRLSDQGLGRYLRTYGSMAPAELQEELAGLAESKAATAGPRIDYLEWRLGLNKQDDVSSAATQELYQQSEQLGQEVASFLTNNTAFKRAPKQLRTLVDRLTADLRNKEQKGKTSSGNVSNNLRKAKVKIDEILAESDRPELAAQKAQLETFLERSKAIEEGLKVARQQEGDTARTDRAHQGPETSTRHQSIAETQTDLDDYFGQNPEAEAAAGDLEQGTFAIQLSEERKGELTQRVKQLAADVGVAKFIENAPTVPTTTMVRESDPETGISRYVKRETVRKPTAKDKANKRARLWAAKEISSNPETPPAIREKAAQLVADLEDLIAWGGSGFHKLKINDPGIKDAEVKQIREVASRVAKGETPQQIAQEMESKPAGYQAKQLLQVMEKAGAKQEDASKFVQSKLLTARGSQGAGIAVERETTEGDVEILARQSSRAFPPAAEPSYANVWSDMLDTQQALPWGDLSHTERVMIGRALEGAESFTDIALTLKNLYGQLSQSRRPDPKTRARPGVREEAEAGYDRAGETDPATAQEPESAAVQAEESGPSSEPAVAGPSQAEPAQGQEAPVTNPETGAKVEVQTKKSRAIRRGHAKAENPTTKEAFTQAVRKFIGHSSHWRLHTYDSMEAAPADALHGHADTGAYGWVVPDDNGVLHAHFVLDRIEQGTELGKLLHEVGAHIGLSNMLPKQLYQNLHAKIGEWALEARLGLNEGELSQAQAIALRAWGRMSDATEGASKEVKQDELIAYFIEEAVAAGVDPTGTKVEGPLGQFLRRVWAAFKTALRKLRLRNIDQLTPQHVVDLAYGAARLDLNQSTQASGREIRFGHDIPAHVSTLKNAIEDTLDSAQQGLPKAVSGWMTLGQLAERFGDRHPAIRRLHQSFKNMQALAKRWTNRAEQIDRNWGELDKARTTLMHEIMQRATLAGFDPETGDRQATTREEHEINRLWNQLQQLDRRTARTATKAADVYRAARDHFEDDINAVREYVKSIDRDNASPRTQELLKVLDKLGRQGKKPFFSLMRQGGFYTVGMSQEMAALDAKVRSETATDAEKKRHRKMRTEREHYIQTNHQSRREAIRHRKDLERRGFRAYENEGTYRAESGNQLLRPEMQQFEAMLSGVGLDSKVADQLKAQYETMLISALPENHALKQSLRREGIYEDNADMRAKFAAAAQFRAHTLSRLAHAREISEATQELVQSGEQGNTEARQLSNEIQQRTQLAFSHDDTPNAIRWLTKLSYLGYLGASPAYMLLNLSQTPAIAAPWLAARNGNKMPQTMTMLIKDMARVQKALSVRTQNGEIIVEFDATKGDFTQQEQKVLQDLVDSGTLEFTIGYDLGAIASGKSDGFERLTRSLNAPTHAIEIMNRAATALSAYRIKHHQSQDHGKSLAFAQEAVDTTQVDYSPSNAARHMQKAFGSKSVARLMFQFYRFQQAMTYLAVTTFKDAWLNPDLDAQTKREARATMAWLSASLTTTSGVLGLPFASGALSLASTVAAALGMGDEEDDIDFERDLKNFIHDHGGPLADVLNQGAIDTLTGAAMGRRMGQGDLMNPFAYTRSGRDDTAEDSAKEMLFALAGAPVSNAVGMWDGAMSLAEGDVQNFMEKAVPLKMIRDVSRAYELSTEGLTERDGDTILAPGEFTALEKAYQAIGLAPVKKQRYYERNSAIQGARIGVEETKKRLMADYRNARTAKERREIWREIIEFGRRNPHARISFRSLRQSARRKQDQQRQRDAGGVLANEQNQPYLDAGRFAQ